MVRPVDSAPEPPPPRSNAAQTSLTLLDRLLNDPDVPLQPYKIWDLAEEVADVDRAPRAHASPR